jgi:hypothetical protein
MGKATDEKVEEIQRTRDQIESDLRELEERVPAPLRSAKRALGIVAGGGVVSAALLAAIRRRGKRRADKQNAEVTVRIVTDRPAVVDRQHQRYRRR